MPFIHFLRQEEPLYTCKRFMQANRPKANEKREFVEREREKIGWVPLLWAAKKKENLIYIDHKARLFHMRDFYFFIALWSKLAIKKLLFSNSKNQYRILWLSFAVCSHTYWFFSLRNLFDAVTQFYRQILRFFPTKFIRSLFVRYIFRNRWLSFGERWICKRRSTKKNYKAKNGKVMFIGEKEGAVICVFEIRLFFPLIHTSLNHISVVFCKLSIFLNLFMMASTYFSGDTWSTDNCF